MDKIDRFTFIAALNQVTLLGRIGTRPKKGGNDIHPVVVFSLATHTNYTNSSGNCQQLINLSIKFPVGKISRSLSRNCTFQAKRRKEPIGTESVSSNQRFVILFTITCRKDNVFLSMDV